VAPDGGLATAGHADEGDAHIGNVYRTLVQIAPVLGSKPKGLTTPAGGTV
jgi:hypothetical protein